MKRLLAAAGALGLAAMLSAAPQTGSTEQSQPSQTKAKHAGGAKHRKHHGAGHSNRSGKAAGKGNPTGNTAPVMPGN